ncbi:MAG TPA: hypothetical protein DCE42_24450 [Myxococcales bacterium]|nr:hypothetical protein [Deltaproteobacteria bacterium]MBU54067.1 hypothetical protein [Deltaproteobacteria bacterium]HAA57938.1 hypothetical protein [Myxococcales bacterium]
MKHQAQGMMVGLFTLLLAGVVYAEPPVIKLDTQTISLNAPVQAGVMVADLDGDQKPEILLSTLHKGIRLIGEKMKWSVELNVGRAVPAIGDLDGDGKPEIVMPFLSDRSTTQKRLSDLAIFDKSGGRQYTLQLPGEVGGAVVLQDINGDKKPEIIMATIEGKLLVIDTKGKAQPGFPKDIKNTLDVSEVTILPTPAVGELDGNVNNGPEIIVATTGGVLHAFHSDGSSLPQYPLTLDKAIMSSPVIGDINNDGEGEIIIVTASGILDVRKLDGTSHQGFPVQLKQPVTATPLVFDSNKDKKKEIFVATLGQFVFGVDAQGQQLPGWPRKVDAMVSASPLAGDVNGDATIDILVVTRAGSLYAFDKQGLHISGYPASAGGPVYATPSLADTKGNGKAEWIVARQDKSLAIVEDPRPSIQSLRYSTPWAVFQGGNAHTGSLNNVTKPSNLIPTAPAQTIPTQPTNPVIEAQSCGCNQTADLTEEFPLHIALMLFFFLVLAHNKQRTPPTV